MNTMIKNSLHWGLALLMIVFGFNKFFGFIAVDPPSDPVAQQFMGAMFGSYLAKVVAINEIVGGTLLLVPKTRFIAWLILAPVIFNIIAFHVAHDFIGNGIWLIPSVLYLGLAYFYQGHFKALSKINSL